MSHNRKHKPTKTTFEHKVKQRRIDDKEKQLELALQYCKDNNCRGFAAISSGICPNIKDQRTINRRLDGILTVGKEKEYCQILTSEEEWLLIDYIRNKCRAFQPVNRKELNDAIIKMLKLRDATNKKKGGRKYIRLSTAAQTTLTNGCAGKSFWQRFDAKHPDLTRRRVSHVSLKRVLACTKDMAISHLDSLAEELISVGIVTNAVRKDPGI